LANTECTSIVNPPYLLHPFFTQNSLTAVLTVVLQLTVDEALYQQLQKLITILSLSFAWLSIRCCGSISLRRNFPTLLYDKPAHYFDVKVFVQLSVQYSVSTKTKLHHKQILYSGWC
jgi:hypothetical protein